MTLSFEALLILGVAGFYLIDSAMLLYVNESVISYANNKWTFASPDFRWQVLGKYLYLPNLLTPGKPIFRICWNVSNPIEDQQTNDALQQFISSLKLLRYLTYCLFIILFFALPLVLLIFGSGIVLLILFGAVYLTIIAMLIQVYRQRDDLKFSNGAFVKLAFDSIACAPHALNLVRKISLHNSPQTDLISFANQHFETESFEQLIRALCNQVGEQIEFEDVSSDRYRTLKNYQDRIRGMLA